MNYRVIVPPKVERLLLQSAQWWASEYSLEDAEKWLDEFLAKIQSLDRLPYRFPCSPENHIFTIEIRDLYFGVGSHSTHRAIFTVKEQQKEVWILTVRHCAQDEIKPDVFESEHEKS